MSTHYLEHISAVTVAHHQGINVQVCNLNHKCDKHLFKWGDHMDPGNPCSAGIWRMSRSWKPLSISSMVLPFHFLLSTRDVRKAVCLMESSATTQPPSGPFHLTNFQFQFWDKIYNYASGSSIAGVDRPAKLPAVPSFVSNFVHRHCRHGQCFRHQDTSNLSYWFSSVLNGNITEFVQ